ncbi:MAG: hypothetical protein PHR35_03315 [Kiritimatiellae bacterium]|nr:hypothetical protein [Kiritimatiellia bacterium]
MKRASVTYTKNNLSRLLGMVREGETVLVVDREVPVARINPVDQDGLNADDHMRMLELKGVVTAPRRKLDVQGYLARKKARPRAGASALRALLREREESR